MVGNEIFCIGFLLQPDLNQPQSQELPKALPWHRYCRVLPGKTKKLSTTANRSWDSCST
jgi:hypothetical protein